MNFKKIYKHINRGLVLAVVLLITTICYVIIGNLNFKKETDTIKGVVNNYAKESVTLSLLPDGANKVGATLTKEQAEKQIKAFDDILSKYWVGAEQSAFGNGGANVQFLKKDFENSIKSMIGKPSKSEIKSVDIKIGELKNVSRDGEKGANVSFTFDVDVKSIGQPSVFIMVHHNNHLKGQPGMDITISQNESIVAAPDKDTEEKIDMTEKTTRISGGGVAKLHKSKGKWKIWEIGNFYTSNH
ncbi:MAG: hypothetical protein RR497_00270 [Oscillospiraceae bacterium]